MRRSAIVLALWLGSSSVAQAQDVSAEDQERAREHFDRGTEHYDAGNYAEAQAEFRASYEIVHHPDLLYNLYTAAERNGDVEVAIESLEGYLRDGEMEDTRRAALELRLERLRLRREREASERERQAREREEAQRRLAAEQAGREQAQREAQAERSERLASLRAGHRTSDGLLWTGLGALIGGGVAAVLFGAFAGLSESEDQSLAETCGRDAGRICRPEDVETLRTWNTAADASWIAASGLGVVGLALVLIAEVTRPSEAVEDDVGPAAWIRPVLAPDRVALSGGARW